MNSTEDPTGEKSTFSQADFPVSLFPQQENEWENQTTVTSGRKCSELYARYSPLGSLVRTFLESSRWKMAQHLKGYSLTWKVKDTPFRRLLFQLQQSGQSTDEIGSGLLPTMRSRLTGNITQERAGDKNRNLEKVLAIGLLGTPTTGLTPRSSDHSRKTPTPAEYAKMMLPTPRAQSANGPGLHGTGGKDLQAFVQGMLPTPITNDAKNDATYACHANRNRGNLVQGLMQENYSGQLSARFVEQMMGFPLNWTDVSD